MMQKGDRVAIHPATDAWMKGDKYGTVHKVGKPRSTPQGVIRPVYVECDRSGIVRSFHPDNVSKLDS